MEDEEWQCRDLAREVNVMQETLNNYCSRYNSRTFFRVEFVTIIIIIIIIIMIIIIIIIIIIIF